MPWKSLIAWSEVISALTSMFLNSVLTYLIITKSPKQIGSYKYLMLFISIFEIIYSIIDVLVSPVIFSTGSVFVVISYMKLELIPKFIWEVLVAVYCSFFGFSMGIFALHFIYRYLVASGSKVLRTFDGLGIIRWFSIPFIYGLAYGSICYFPLKASDKTTDAIKNDILFYLDWNIEQTAYIGPYLYQKQPDGSTEIDLPSFFAIGGLSFIIDSSICAISYYGFRCFQKIKKLMQSKETHSRNFHQLQSQLFYALITETLIPVVLMHFPAMVLFISVFMGEGIPTISGVTSITISLFPALDPLPTMFIIKNYRNAILGFIKPKIGSKLKSGTHT